jgi:dTDP-4-dehydrorhamnose reductase
MLGHELWRHFHISHETWVTLRGPGSTFHRYGLFQEGRVCSGVDVQDVSRVESIIREISPDVVLNCVGIIKQLKEANDPISSITVNALLPHRLSEICKENGARLILFSTDCVFSGKRGGYTESDIPDADDLYGRTKYLGEVHDQLHTVTIRSSIIGRELGTAHSLVDWFISNKGKAVHGYRKAIYSGFTTVEMARIVGLILDRPDLNGLLHVASEPITKYHLLCLIRDKFDLQIEIKAYDQYNCDRSLIGDRFNKATKYSAPNWDMMIQELAEREQNGLL